MIHQMYAVFDCKTVTYGKPFIVTHKGAAVRGFTEISNDSTSEIGKYPDDFTLYELGSYDDSCGKMVQHNEPVFVAKAREFVKPV